MSTKLNVTVAGIFPTADEANRAAEELQRAGFQDEEIGVVPGRAINEAGARTGPGGVTIGTGAGAGMLTGAALGGLVAGLPGLVAAGVAGAALGAFIDLGIPEDSASFYQSELEAGSSVVLVRSAGRSDEAANLLRMHGAKEVRLSSASAGEEG